MESALKVVSLESTPTPIRQLILKMYQYDAYVDGFVWEMTLEKRLSKQFP